MFAACRPVIRHGDRGHIVVEGEGECEDGHPVVGDDPAGQAGDSFLGQLRAAVQYANLYEFPVKKTQP